MADVPTVVRASNEELRRLFNAAYLAGVLSGHYRLRDFGLQTLYKNWSDSPYPPEPDGTVSGLIEIIDPGTTDRVAVAHRLLRPDGSFGASGYPDPKMVIIGGAIYVQKRKEGRRPSDAKLPSLFTDSG
jgi:hypothetical protein